MTEIKLCGLTRANEIAWANELQPDYVGFVFAPKSRRYVYPQAAAELRSQLDPEIATVGVFVDADIVEIAELVAAGTINVIQLHGSESEEYLTQLRAALAKLSVETPKIIQAFGLASEHDVDNANQSSADIVLLDAPGGGTGEPFNWDLLAGIKREYFLAGGLTPENVGSAITRLQPDGVDVSSGIETAGLKDQEKMADFVQAVRTKQADQN
ncbi:MAG: phosphoribosylanthranilate isomerase [Arcanobacterium sp.]|nr:phosphoribosylanthranilate isomerase [Arcanobacterium sp.]